MRDRPRCDALLAIARAALIKDVLPQIAADQRMSALMVARALEIVGREIVAGDAAERGFGEGLAEFYDQEAPRDAAALDALARRLAGDLRVGAFERAPERQQAAYALLLVEALARVALSNPRYLGAL